MMLYTSNEIKVCFIGKFDFFLIRDWKEPIELRTDVTLCLDKPRTRPSKLLWVTLH